MESCAHKNLVLIKKPDNKLRCRHCYLTISRDELESDFCPECWETDGIKRRDFEKVEQNDNGSEIYRCEDCGIPINTGE